MFTKIARYHAKAGPVTTDDTGAELGTIVVYGSTWDVDLGSDQIVKGAYTNTIKSLKKRAQERGTIYLAPILHEHQPGAQLGSWYDFKEDDTGLKCSGHLALGIEKAKELYLLARSGMGGDQWSITYTIPQGGATYGRDGIRTITELDLASVDVVSFAMNPETRLVSVKDRNRMYRRTKASLDAALRAHVATLRKAADNRDFKAVRRVADEIEDNYLTVAETIPEDMANIWQGSVPTFAGYDNNGNPKSRTFDGSISPDDMLGRLRAIRYKKGW